MGKVKGLVCPDRELEFHPTIEGRSGRLRSAFWKESPDTNRRTERCEWGGVAPDRGQAHESSLEKFGG